MNAVGVIFGAIFGLIAGLFLGVLIGVHWEAGYARRLLGKTIGNAAFEPDPSLYHPKYGQMDRHWAEVCKPYADTLQQCFPEGKENTYIAVVDDERGRFICVNDREFKGRTLDEAFYAAANYIGSDDYTVDWNTIHPNGR